MNSGRFKGFWYIGLPLIFIFSLCITIGYVAGSHLKQSAVSQVKQKPLYSQAIVNSRHKFTEVLQYLERLYVSDIDMMKLMNSTLKDMIESLDPYSTYIDSKLILKSVDNSENRSGIGLNFCVSKNVVQVVSPLFGSSAEWSGIRPLDIIVAIDNESIVGKSITDVDIENKLNGPDGSKLNLTIKRKGEEEDQNFIITRSNVYNKEVVSFMISENIGYLKFSCFSPNISKEIVSTINGLIKLGMKNLILDLRNNSSNEFDEVYIEAINIVDKFLHKGQLILSLKARSETYNSTVYAKSKDEFLGLKIIILVNSGTAGAAEILAGSLQDNDRALLLGESRTFGKGIVRSLVKLQDGSQLKISVAKIYTPSGRLIQRKSNNIFSMEKNIKFDQFSNPGYFRADAISVEEHYHTAMGRTIFGGGGIVPDFIVIPDTDYRPIYMDRIKNIIKKIAEDYAAQYVTVLNKRGEDDFIKSFEVPNIIIDQVKVRAHEEGFLCEESVYRGLKNMIKSEIKMYIAQYIWKESGFFRMKVSNDPFVLKAMVIFNEYDILLPLVCES